ncbi:MAG: hypothetical protein ACRCZF_05470, partial [Gemmataceae bacterium]
MTREYILKGIVLALWCYLALLLSPAEPDWPRFTRVVLLAAAGLAFGLIIGAIQLLAAGMRPFRNLPAFLLMTILESSYWVYLGFIGALAGGIVLEYGTPSGPRAAWLIYFTLGGIVLGYGLAQLTLVREWAWRFGLAAVLGMLLAGTGIYYLGILPDLGNDLAARNFGIVLLIGLPFFYCLTFCGYA